LPSRFGSDWQDNVAPTQVRIQAFGEIVIESLATRQDARLLGQYLEARFALCERRMTIRIGVMLAAWVAILAAIMKLL
jgi:hypothetical protein